MKKSVIIVAILAIIVGGIALWAWPKEEAKIEFETTLVDLDTLRNSVTATGTIEPVTEVEVGTQVSGIVSKLYVDYNSVVKKGQVIAELDRTNLMSELNTAKANQASAKSELNYQESNYKRYKALNEKGLVSKNEYETNALSYRKALEAYHTATENVKRAQTNLGYATITSPIDGVVLSKDVEEGQTVASSFSTPTLFTIAQNLTDMRVVADIDEADIGDVKEGQKVSFTVDAYPNNTFNGEVTQVRQMATTTNNVVTYEVVISAPNDDLKLKPGLTANVTITTLERPSVLSVKQKALRFTPATEVITKKFKIVDCAGKNKVWTLNGQEIKAHAVTLGASDGVRTEIKSGIEKGAQVITSMSEVKAETPASEEASEQSPFMPQPPGKNKK